MNKTRARSEQHLKLLLLFTVIAMVGFGFPQLLWATHVGYTLIALLLTQVMGRQEHEPHWSRQVYRGLGLCLLYTSPSPRD